MNRKDISTILYAYRENKDLDWLKKNHKETFNKLYDKNLDKKEKSLAKKLVDKFMIKK